MKKTLFSLLFLNIAMVFTLFSQEGKLDMQFGKKGIVQLSLDTSYLSYNITQKIGVQADDMLVVGGKFSSNILLARFKENGKLDELFGTEGKVVIKHDWQVAEDIRDLAILPDGDILVLVETTHFNPDVGEYWGKTMVMRFNQNGDFDDTFGKPSIYGESGTAFLETGFDFTRGKFLLPQPDGKIIVGGEASQPFGGFKIFISRLNEDGSVDNSFINNGLATLTFGGEYDHLTCLTLQPDGKILLGGLASVSSGQVNKATYALSRLTNNGNLDNGFGTNGLVTGPLPAPSNYYILCIMPQPNGDFLAWLNQSEFTTNKIDVIHFNSDGNVDASFGNNGIVTVSTGELNVVTKILTDTEGYYFLAGYEQEIIQFGDGPGDFALVKLNPDFTRTASFGTSGVVVKEINNGTNDRVIDAALLSDNKILLAGNTSSIYYESKIALAKYYGRDTLEIITPKDSIKQQENLTIIIFPNPITDKFDVCYRLDEPTIVSVELFDESGRLQHVFLEKQVQSTGNQCIQFEWPKNIGPGVYFIWVHGRIRSYFAKVLKNTK